jgi:hypothetical protein
MPSARFRLVLLAYFKHPFPKAEGFSAYKMPGLLVHVPVILIFGSLGVWLCGGDPWLYPLFLVYAVAGVYLGRDLAILAHYHGLILLGVLAAAFFLVGFHEDWPRPGAATSVLVTLALALLSAGWAKRWSDRQTKSEPGLHRLVQAADLKAIERALDEGADPNEKDTLLGWGYSPLHVAVALPDSVSADRVVAIIEALAQRGADLHAMSEYHGTPLHLAVEKKKLLVVRCLLALKADPNYPKRTGLAGARGMTPLHLAARQGDREMLEELMAAGGDINARGEDGSALSEAVLGEHLDLIPWLLEKGARPGAGDKALAYVVGSRDARAIEMTQRLIDAGARVEDALLLGAATAEMIRFLAAHGAKVDSLLRNGRNPAFISRDEESRPARLRALRELGCDLASADAHGRTILHDVARHPLGAATLPEVLPELLAAGVNVNAADEDGATALYLLVKGMLPYVTGRNIVGLKEKLPVATAIALLDLLLDAGADPAIANKEGEDAVAVARRLKAPRDFLARLEKGGKPPPNP